MMFTKSDFTPIGRVTGPIVSNLPNSGGDIYLFDLDAITTRSHGHLEHSFAVYLEDFARRRPCYLLTRENYNNVVTRVQNGIRQTFAGIFAASGTELWVGQEIRVRSEHDFPDELYEFVVNVVQKSAYPGKLAPLIDNGAASLRICLAGTHSTVSQLKAYSGWEGEHQELPDIMREFQVRFPDYSIYQDTDTSLLVLPNSYSSALVQNSLLKRHKTARLICYLTERSVTGYADPLCNALLSSDIVSVVEAPSDVSQLLSYENRRHSGVEPMIDLHHSEYEEV
ncbi:MAG: hypothetical protein ABJP66_20375 [Hyphomicrobiales bacterium]